MYSKSLKTLEYTKIIERLAEYASSPLGIEKCQKLEPICDLKEIRRLQKETSDALARLWKKGAVSFSGTRDIRSSLKRLEIGSTLSARELLDIASVLTVALRIKPLAKISDNLNTNQREDMVDDGAEYEDSLAELFSAIEPLSPLSNELKRCIITEEEIADDASAELSSIRRAIRHTNDKIHNVMNAMVTSSTVRTYLQDNVVTMRNGRYCLPVKAEYKSSMPGMVHDQSSTGSTIFIEPMSVVQMNNELSELAIKEQREIEKILADLSNLCAEHVEDIATDFQVLSELDFIFARAALSKALKCTEPEFNTDGIINLKCARHPLLDQTKVVPIDIRLGDNYNLLVVTGPNTGGKTVSLKTVGLLTLMGQSGLHIPADDGSKLAVFNQVYADIGDEQSIEQSLSTFSSHMTNIIKILEEADDKSLVLFDELCAGTDPVEGAALAISILTFLHNLNVKTMTTTHYSELKVFALSTEGVENACCEFNVDTLSPTYRLLIGIPGKSNAFAISLKLGLPNFIVEDAKSRLNDDSKSFEDILTDLEESKITIEREKEEIQTYKAEIAELKEKLEKKTENLDDRRERILREANEEAMAILQDAKSFADETIRKFNKLGKGTSAADLENERHKLRGKMSDTEKKLVLKNKKAPKKAYTAADFTLGSAVKVLSLNLNGTVSSLPNAKGDLFVQMGILRSQVNISDLELIDEPVVTGPNLQKTSSGKIKMSKGMNVATEINLIGMTTAEAIPALDKYLDDAYLAHLASVRVVHGRGTGALKNAVHSHLKRLKYVKEYRLGSFGEGDTGVTIVTFK
ncbi:MAG: endonuclease MutS2 [Lachnospiraceae bacterium]|nr:endonuclease MutS2 [Lachnospiraceae bacterium]